MAKSLKDVSQAPLTEIDALRSDPTVRRVRRAIEAAEYVAQVADDYIGSLAGDLANKMRQVIE